MHQHRPLTQMQASSAGNSGGRQYSSYADMQGSMTHQAHPSHSYGGSGSGSQRGYGYASPHQPPSRMIVDAGNGTNTAINGNLMHPPSHRSNGSGSGSYPPNAYGHGSGAGGANQPYGMSPQQHYSKMPKQMLPHQHQVLPGSRGPYQTSPSPHPPSHSHSHPHPHPQAMQHAAANAQPARAYSPMQRPATIAPHSTNARSASMHNGMSGGAGDVPHANVNNAAWVSKGGAGPNMDDPYGGLNLTGPLTHMGNTSGSNNHVNTMKTANSAQQQMLTPTMAQRHPSPSPIPAKPALPHTPSHTSSISPSNAAKHPLPPTHGRGGSGSKSSKKSSASRASSGAGAASVAAASNAASSAAASGGDVQPIQPDAENPKPRRVDLRVRKAALDKLLGSAETQREYWNLIEKFIMAKLSKMELEEFVIEHLGRENLHVHNDFFLAILQNAHSDELPPKPVKKKKKRTVEEKESVKEKTKKKKEKDKDKDKEMKSKDEEDGEEKDDNTDTPTKSKSKSDKRAASKVESKATKKKDEKNKLESKKEKESKEKGEEKEKEKKKSSTKKKSAAAAEADGEDGMGTAAPKKKRTSMKGKSKKDDESTVSTWLSSQAFFNHTSHRPMAHLHRSTAEYFALVEAHAERCRQLPNAASQYGNGAGAPGEDDDDTWYAAQPAAMSQAGSKLSSSSGGATASTTNSATAGSTTTASTNYASGYDIIPLEGHLLTPTVHHDAGRFCARETATMKYAQQILQKLYSPRLRYSGRADLVESTHSDDMDIVDGATPKPCPARHRSSSASTSTPSTRLLAPRSTLRSDLPPSYSSAYDRLSCHHTHRTKRWSTEAESYLKQMLTPNNTLDTDNDAHVTSEEDGEGDDADNDELDLFDEPDPYERLSAEASAAYLSSVQSHQLLDRNAVKQRLYTSALHSGMHHVSEPAVNLVHHATEQHLKSIIAAILDFARPTRSTITSPSAASASSSNEEMQDHDHDGATSIEEYVAAAAVPISREMTLTLDLPQPTVLRTKGSKGNAFTSTPMSTSGSSSSSSASSAPIMATVVNGASTSSSTGQSTIAPATPRPSSTEQLTDSNEASAAVSTSHDEAAMDTSTDAPSSSATSTSINATSLATASCPSSSLSSSSSSADHATAMPSLESSHTSTNPSSTSAAATFSSSSSLLLSASAATLPDPTSASASVSISTSESSTSSASNPSASTVAASPNTDDRMQDVGEHTQHDEKNEHVDEEENVMMTEEQHRQLMRTMIAGRPYTAAPAPSIPSDPPTMTSNVNAVSHSALPLIASHDHGHPSPSFSIHRPLNVEELTHTLRIHTNMSQTVDGHPLILEKLLMRA